MKISKTFLTIFVFFVFVCMQTRCSSGQDLSCDDFQGIMTLLLDMDLGDREFDFGVLDSFDEQKRLIILFVIFVYFFIYSDVRCLVLCLSCRNGNHNTHLPWQLYVAF